MSPTTSQSQCMRLQTDDVRLLEVKAGVKTSQCRVRVSGSENEHGKIENFFLLGNDKWYTSYLGMSRMEIFCAILNLHRIELPTQDVGEMRVINSARNTT